MLVPTGQQRSPWSRSRPCDTLVPIPLGFIIVILFIFSIKNKKSHIQQRVLCGSLSLAPPSCSSPPALPPHGPGPALAIPSFCRGWVQCPRLPVVSHPSSLSSFLPWTVLPDSTSNSGATRDGNSKLVPWLRLAFEERLNFTSTPLCPQEDPLLVKTRSGVG